MVNARLVIVSRIGFFMVSVSSWVGFVASMHREIGRIGYVMMLIDFLLERCYVA